MTNKVRGSVIDLPLLSATKPVATTYPAGTVAYNTAGTAPVGWKYNGTSWEDFSAVHLEASTTYDPAAITAGSYLTTNVTVTGAALGDYAKASFSLDHTGVIISAHVFATNTVTVTLHNITAGSINLASGTLKVRVERK